MVRLCALCSKTTIHNDFQQFDSLKCDMLQVIHPELAFTSKDGLYICKDCEEKLTKFFSFKNCCLEIDDYLQSFLNHEDKMDLNLALHRIKGRDFDNQEAVNQTCRLCLDTIGDPSTLGTQAHVGVMMKACLPEVELQITDQSTFCSVCLQHLTEQFNFIQSLTNLEEKLSKSRAYRISNKNNCDLFENKAITCNELIGDMVCKIAIGPTSMEIPCAILQTKEDVEQVTTNINTESSIQVNGEGTNAKEGELYYSCTKCTFKSKIDYSLKLHLLLSHSDMEKFVSPKKLDGIMMYRCKDCHFQTNREYNIWSHVITHERSKPSLKPYRCKYKAGYRNVEYKTHNCRLKKRKPESGVDNGRKNKKEQNGTTAKEGSTVTTKKKAKPKKQKKYRDSAIDEQNEREVEVVYYECNKCQYKSKNNYSFKLHSLLSHSNVDTLISAKTSGGMKVYICNYCGFEADRDYNIWSHVILHMESKSFRKPYNCKHCSYRCGPLSPKLHTCKNKKKKAKSTRELDSLYRCTLCSIKSDKLGAIKKHLRVHLANNSKVHRCKTCLYKTNCKNNLQRHISTICYQGDDQLVEEREVTEVPHFKCQFCTFQETDEKQFMKHIEQHPEKEVYIRFYKTVRIPKMTEAQLGPAVNAV